MLNAGFSSLNFFLSVQVLHYVEKSAVRMLFFILHVREGCLSSPGFQGTNCALIQSPLHSEKDE